MTTPPLVERPAMAGYGVPTEPAGVLPWAWGRERLVRNRNYWVVTASASGRPHALPVWGVWLPETDRFWFSCSPDARKLRNIAENPQCVVTVDDTVECVSVEGRARVADPVQDPDDVQRMIAAYLQKYWADPEVHAEMERFLRANTIVEIAPERAFGIIERHEEFAQRATRWRW
jgi:PPOX class probable F420-dependent enzyme